MKYNQQLVILICFLILFNSITNLHHKSRKSSTANKNKLKSTQVLFQGWTHYYLEKDFLEGKPKQFFENGEYSRQRIKMSEKDKADENGYLAIPDRSSYFLVIYSHIVSIFSSRDKIERKNVDNFHIKNIGIIPEDEPKLGSIKDVGKVNKFFCIQIKTNVPEKLAGENEQVETYKELWTLCFDKEDVKRKVLSILIDSRIKYQREKGIMITAEQMPDKEESKKEEKESGSESPQAVDGKLILLQDWSECTLKCGGGKSYQQFMCIPPKNGGSPCDGDLIKEKDCNSQPCPLATQLVNKEEESEEYKKPIVKIGPYSSRHNRYSRCVIKEGDGFRLELNKDTQDYNRIPSKFLMNIKTFSIYEDDSYTKLIHSFPLDKTNFTREKDFCTFSLQDNMEKIILRGFEQSCGSIEEDKFVKSWNRDFNSFRSDCVYGREDVLIDEDEQKRIDNLAKKSSEMINIAKQQENAEKLRDDFSSSQQGALSQNLKATKKTGLKAINKESEIENMIVQEEKEREELELKHIQKQIDSEKAKSESLSLTIKEKELDDVFVQQDRESEQEIVEAKEEAKDKIVGKRNDLRKKIEQMRKLAAMKKNQLQGSLKKAKTKLAKNVMSALKKGSSVECNKGKVEGKEDIRKAYCNSHFPDDYFLNTECQLIDNFCYTCCETEFGNLNMSEREDCYNECDGLKEPKKDQEKAKEKKKEIQWVWSNKK